MAESASLHRVRRLRWQASASNTADAFALQRLLRRRSDEVGVALEQGLSSIGAADEVWHLPSLTLRLEAGSLAQMDADLPALVARALRAALTEARQAAAAPPGLVTSPAPAPAADRAQPGIVITAAESAQAALRHYLSTGSLPWTLAGLSPEAQQQTLQAAAQAALEAMLAQHDIAAALTELLGASTPLPASIGALLRWLPLLSATQRQRWLAASPRPPGVNAALADRWFALLADADTAMSWHALWLAWPTVLGARGSAGSPASSALADWIAALPADMAALRLTPRDATEDKLAAALLNALGESTRVSTPSPPPRPSPPSQSSARPVGTATAPDALLVPLAGLVLLHPYLPRFLNACGLPDIDEAALPRACALLHALACGDAAAAEHQLPLIKLLLGRAPDAPLTAALPRLSTDDRDEVDSLLDAVRSHWKALGSTSADGLRLSFLQRRGLLRRADAAWQLHVQPEAFDLLLGLLPWSISLVKLPWMPLPLMVEWHAP